MACFVFTQNKWRRALTCSLLAAMLITINLPNRVFARQQNTAASVIAASTQSPAPSPIQQATQKTIDHSSNHELYLRARSSSELKVSNPKHIPIVHSPTVSNYSEQTPPNSIKNINVMPSAALGIPLVHSILTDSLKTQATRLPPDARITFEFRNAALPDVLQAFSTFTGANLIISNRVHGTVSMRLENVPWREAFDMLLATQGLAVQQRGNILWIAPASDIARQERQHFESQTLAIDTAAITTAIFEMHYQRAEEVLTLLNGTGGAGGGMGSERLLSKRGVAMVDSRTNQLFIIDVPKRIEQIKHLLLAVDRPVPQVSIEAHIVEAEEGFSRSLGARLSLLGGGSSLPTPGEGANKGPAGGTNPPLTASSLVAGEKGVLYDLFAASLSGFNPASIGFTLFGAGASRIIALELSALEASGKGKILSSPRVVTANRVKAQIEQGTELPYQAKVGNGVSGVQFRRAGLKLEVTPNIMPNGYVTLDVDVSKDSVGAETLSGPAINTKHVQTQVHVENAGTVAIGGIFTHDQRIDVVGLPWLSKLPIVGALFRRSMKNQRKNELLIFITPHIITENA